jgi:hypothetical protein
MRLITFSACVEAVTGLVLIIDPSMVAWLLLGAELSDSGQAVGRVAGFALLALAMACWPERERTSRAATRALLTYNLLAAIFFHGVVVMAGSRTSRGLSDSARSDLRRRRSRLK